MDDPRHATNIPVASGPFQATCLGTVQNRDPVTRELVIDPIAIFR